MAGGRSGLDLSDPKIAEAYAKVCGDESGKCWMALGYESGNKVVVVQEGEGGWGEVGAGLPEDEVRFILATARPKDGTAHRRFLCVWLPEGVGGMKRARCGIHKNAVAHHFDGLVGDLKAESKEEMTPDVVTKEIGSKIGKEIEV